MTRNNQSDEKQGPKTEITLCSKAIVQNGRADKELPRQEKSKGVHHHQTIIIRNVKGTYLRRKKERKKYEQ